MSEGIYVGVDLGGTAIKVGICNSEGQLLQTYEGPTGTGEGVETILSNIEQYVRQIVEDSPYSWDQLQGVGAGIAGFLNSEDGVVVLAPNVGFKDVPIRALLEKRIGKPVKIENDANVAALGEAWAGVGKGVANCVCFTLGTGVGGGIIIGGKIYQGFSGMAGEVGHIAVVPDLEAIQCGCGKMGCLETVSSATGIIRMAKDAVERGELTALAQVEHIMAKDVFDAAKQGDETAVRIVRRAAFYLGKAMATTAAVLNPQMFIVGGGVSKAGDILFDELREVVRQLTPGPLYQELTVVPAILGNDAGVVGAAGLLLRS